MPSLHGADAGATVSGVNTPDLDADGVEDTIGSEWSPETEARRSREFADHGADIGWLPNSILFDNDLSPALRLTLTAMSAYSRGGQLDVTQYRLAKRLGISRQTLSEHMTNAVAAGLLQRLVIDGEVFWRLRWLTFKRQAVPDAQRQAVPDSQAAPDAPHAHAHAGSPVLTNSSSSSSSVSVVDKKAKKTPSLTDDERAWMHKRYDPEIGATFVDEQIEAALTYPSAKSKTNFKAYVNNWLIKSVEQVNKVKAAKLNAQAAEERYKHAKNGYGTPAADPYKTETAPFIVRSVYDIEPSRDRTND